MIHMRERASHSEELLRDVDILVCSWRGTRIDPDQYAIELQKVKAYIALHNSYGLQKQIWHLIQNPIRWSGGEPTEEDQQTFYDEFANRVSHCLLITVRRRVADERHRDWQSALQPRWVRFDVSSGKIIAEDVYAQAAPVSQAVPTVDGNAFVREVSNALRDTAAELKVALR